MASSINEESKLLKEVQAEIASILKPWMELLRVKPTSGDSLEKLAALLDKAPEALATAEGLRAAVAAARERVAQAKAGRRQSFRAVEAEFIRTLRDENRSIRELDRSWRVGPIELEIQREQAKVRPLFNHQPLLEWKAVSGVESLRDVFQAGLTRLEKTAIPESDLSSAARDAYEDVVRVRRRQGKADAEVVPALDFLRAFRLELIRRELSAGKPDRKLAGADLPMFGLLYNMDRYRQGLGKVPKDQQLLFQTGAQREQAKGMGIVLNGLDPLQDYQVYCYVRAVTAGAAFG